MLILFHNLNLLLCDHLQFNQYAIIIEYSSEATRSSANTSSYSQEQAISNNHSTASSPSAVKPDSPIKSYSNISISQPTTPRPNGSPIQPIHTSITQPSSPQDTTKIETPMQPVPTTTAPPPYIVGSNNNNNIRRKRRESDYTVDSPTFGSTQYLGNVFSTDKSTILDVRIQSKVDRGFFLADNDWTCYRRNYFQISSSFSLQNVVVLYDGQELPCLVQDQDMLHDVQQFYLGISAKLSDCDKPIALIQHTAKRDKGPQSTPEPKPIRPGGNLSFSSVGANQSIVTFERIQFKSATANNGKRRAAQQYYVLCMELYAKIRSTGKLVLVATTESQALVVRGRSPGHYNESHGTSMSRSPSNNNKNSHTNINSNDHIAGGPMRRHHSHHATASPMNTNNNTPNHHPHQPPPPHHNTTLTSPPMIPGHPHTSSYPTHHHHHHHPPPPPHPSALYGSEYSNYDYPSSAHGNTGMHYAYAPHAGVPLVPGGSHPPSSNGSYDYHPHPPPSHHPPPHPAYPSAPIQRSDHHPNVYDHAYPPPPPPPHQQSHYLPPPMHRSESAPSAYEHFKEDDQQQQQQQQQHHWARVRMASTPGHHPHQSSPTTEHNPSSTSSYVSHPNNSNNNNSATTNTTNTSNSQPNDQHTSSSHAHAHHTHAPPPPPPPHPYYSQHPSHHMPYYSHPSSHHRQSSQQPVYGQHHPETPTTPVDITGYHHGYSNNWQWRQQSTVPSHHVENYQQKDNMVKMEAKSEKQ
ncbi:unnamed protein product [Cunninghamella echinulata]